MVVWFLSEVELLFAGCVAEARLSRSAQWLQTAGLMIDSSPNLGTQGRVGMASVVVAQTGDSFLHGLYVNEAVVTAVAVDWPGISSQFSVELCLQFQVKDMYFSLLANVWFPYSGQPDIQILLCK